MMSYEKDYILKQLEKCIAYYSLRYKVKKENDDTFITLGDNRSDRSRVLITVDETTNEIVFVIGRSVGCFYSNGLFSSFIKPGQADYRKEVILCFPELYQAVEFIRINGFDREKKVFTSQQQYITKLKNTAGLLTYKG